MNKFTSPPKEWIEHRLEELRDTLNQNTVTSSIALKELLGNISLEPVTDKKSDFYYIVSNGDIKFKPYYIAHTKIQTLTLLDDKYKGSNWLHWRREWDSFFRLTPFAAETRTPFGPSFRIQKTWIHHVSTHWLCHIQCLNVYHWRTQSQPIRTISEISAHIQILSTREIPLYQKLSLKAKQLYALGMSHNKIAKELNTSETTIVRACKYNN